MDLRDIKEFLKDTFKYIVTVVIVLVIIIYVVSVQQVVGPSMSPTLNNGDILILNKFNYKIFDVKRFDIISVSSKQSKYLVKRVIGLPGEKVEYKDNKLYINDQILEEEFLDESIMTNDFSLSSLGYETIPDGMYFVVGDNRGNSDDSRDAKIGLIKEEDIIGKSTIRIWPLNKIGLPK